ncbi:MAG: SCO family protein [Mariprofundaceae bacterium]
MNKNSPVLPIIGMIIALSLAGFGWINLNKVPENEFPEFNLSFKLHNSHGPFQLTDIKGKVGLLFFGYAHCPDVCPTIMVSFGQAIDLLSEDERDKIKALFISLDPKRDTPEVMAKYTGFFHSDIIGLSGNPDETEAAAKSFLIAYEKDKPNQIGNYSMNHSTYIFIVRPDGHLGRLMGHKSSPEEIVTELRYWIKWAD